jgi:hypothetical protein
MVSVQIRVGIRLGAKVRLSLRVRIRVNSIFSPLRRYLALCRGYAESTR